MTPEEQAARAKLIETILRGLKAYAPNEIEMYGRDEAEMIADYVGPYIAAALRTAREEIARLQADAQCWEPDHTHDILRGDGMLETRRLPRVHCPACTDAALRTAREEGEEAVRMERIRLTALWEDRIRMALEKYGHHTMRCAAWGPGAIGRACTCGLADAIRARAQESEG